MLNVQVTRILDDYVLDDAEDLHLTALQTALSGRRDLDLALLPGESLNDDGLFMDSMHFDLLAAGVPMELRPSKDFVDALYAPAAA